MTSKKNGSNFEITTWEGQLITVYLARQEAKALLFIYAAYLNRKGCVHPYELAYHLWSSKYINYENLESRLYSELQDGVADAMKIISKIVSTFRVCIKGSGLEREIHDPFPFFLANNPKNQFDNFITIFDGIKDIKCIPVNNDEEI